MRHGGAAIQNTLQQAETSAIAEVNRIGNNITNQTLSTPLNKRADLIARKALVRKITGVASTPDMRLKVNKRLAAQYKDENKKEKYKEDRKDERTRIQASQQSELIDQRNTGKPPKKFESTGNDNLGTGFDLGQFIPR